MVKGSHTSSILTGKDKYCYLTGEERGLEKHHIYFGASLRRRPGNKWGWRNRKGSIPLTRVLRMMICRSEE